MARASSPAKWSTCRVVEGRAWGTRARGEAGGGARKTARGRANAPCRRAQRVALERSSRRFSRPEKRLIGWWEQDALRRTGGLRVGRMLQIQLKSRLPRSPKRAIQRYGKEFLMSEWAVAISIDEHTITLRAGDPHQRGGRRRKPGTRRQKRSPSFGEGLISSGAKNGVPHFGRPMAADRRRTTGGTPSDPAWQPCPRAAKGWGETTTPSSSRKHHVKGIPTPARHTEANPIDLCPGVCSLRWGDGLVEVHRVTRRDGATAKERPLSRPLALRPAANPPHPPSRRAFEVVVSKCRKTEAESVENRPTDQLIAARAAIAGSHLPSACASFLTCRGL